jgi:hypothetical protein
VNRARWTMDDEQSGDTLLVREQRKHLQISPWSASIVVPGPSHPHLAPPSLRARSHHEPPPPLPSRLSLGDSSWRSILTLLRTAATLIDVCVVLTSAVPIPLKRAGVLPLTGTIQSIDASPTVSVPLIRHLLSFRRRAIAPDSGGVPCLT